MSSTSAPPRTNTLTIVGFIAAFLLPYAGLVLSILALRQLKRPNNIETGLGLAKAGVWISAVLVVIQTTWFIWIATQVIQAINRAS